VIRTDEVHVSWLRDPPLRWGQKVPLGNFRVSGNCKHFSSYLPAPFTASLVPNPTRNVMYAFETYARKRKAEPMCRGESDRFPEFDSE